MVGHTVTLTTTDNHILEGIFHTFTPFDSLNDDLKNKYVIKACRTIQQQGDNGEITTTNNNNGDKPILIEEGGTLVIPSHRVASVQVKSMRLDNNNINTGSASAASLDNTSMGEGGGADTSTFQTDSQISGGRGGTHSLVAAGSVWTSAGDGSDATLGSGSGGIGGGPYRPSSSSSSSGMGKKGSDSLNWRAAAARGGTSLSSTKSSSAPSTGVSGALDGSIGDWDQFSANERKFNVKASFDENLYTTKLDVSNIDTAKIAEAERIAREIEGTASSNIHVAEERNQAIQTDYDEEDLYSGVLTKDLKARTIAVVPDAPSSNAAATTTTTSNEGEKKKGAPVVGKVMNYAQAAAKKGMAEKSAKPPTPAASTTSTATTSTATTPASTSKDAEKATLSADNTSTTPASAEKTVEPESAVGKPSGAHTEVKASNNDNRDNKEGGATKDEKAERAAATATTTSKLKLNPNAKAFTFNPSAKSFTPTFATPAASPMPPMQPPPPHSMDAPMMVPPHPHPHGDYPGGPPMMSMGMGGPQFAPMHGKLHSTASWPPTEISFSNQF